MKQRIVIAMALAADPDLLIADEPTTALDVTVQAQIIRLLGDLVARARSRLMLITHDMGVVAQACDRVVVIYAGTRRRSTATSTRSSRHPRHPYTQALIGCIPRDGMAPGSLKGIEGVVPSVAHYPSGCRFHPRCPRAEAICADGAADPSCAAAGGGGGLPFRAGCGPHERPARKSATCRKRFSSRRGLFGRSRAMHAVNDVSFSMCHGQGDRRGRRIRLREIDASPGWSCG